MFLWLPMKESCNIQQFSQKKGFLEKCTCFQLETIVMGFFQRCWPLTLLSFQAVCGWWDMIGTYYKSIFNVIYKNRKMMTSSNFKWTSLWKFQSHNILELSNERGRFFTNNFLTVNFETKFGDCLNFIVYPRKFISLWQGCIKVPHTFKLLMQSLQKE